MRRRHDVLIYLPTGSTVVDLRGVTPAGGAEMQMALLARGLVGLGARVAMVVYDSDRRGETPDSVDGIDLVPRSPYRYSAGVRGGLREAAEMYANIAAARADTVVTMCAVPATGLLALAAKLQRRHLVYASASAFDFDYATVEPKPRNVRLFHLGVRMADQIVVQNAEQRELCQRRFGRSAVVIKSIAEDAELRTQPPEAFLWAGRIVRYKRPLEFVELARRLPEARFWMVGLPGRDRPDVGQEVRDAARATPNLELLDPLPRHELMRLVARAVAVVNTSDLEGLPNTFIEAWARGVPALSLAYDPDGLIERHRLGGFAAGSAERLAALARQLWDSRHDQGELAARCRRYVRTEHSPDTVYSRWFDTLGLAAAGRQAPAFVASGATPT